MKRCFALTASVFLVFFCVIQPGISNAQLRHSPDNENVEAAARKAFDWISGQELFGTNDTLLAALVVNEVTKRYDRAIAEDHPVVQRAIEQVLSSLPSDPTVNPSGSTYSPALACILLCDVDDRKYADEIRLLLRVLENFQLPNGGYNYRGKNEAIGDISQAQYVGLAYFVARHHNFDVNLDSAKALLEWIINSQFQSTWYYHSVNGQLPQVRGRERPLPVEETTQTLSRHCAGLGTCYLLADLLQLAKRSRAFGSAGGGEKLGLPPSVTVYVKPIDGQVENKEGPLVQFNSSALSTSKSTGNRWLDANFTVQSDSWNYYYLYALERYAFFRELQDGSVREVPDWYDQGVDYLLDIQNGDGSFPQAQEFALTPLVSTCLATLFLVRSSEVLILPSQSGNLAGNIGFVVGERIVVRSDGSTTAAGAIKGVEDAIRLLGQASGAEQKELIVEAMKESVRNFSDGERSRIEIEGFLEGLIKDPDYFKRQIAVDILAGEQKMDNVVPLLYALGDPDERICISAHNGLRLISRKIDSIPLPANPGPEDFIRLKRVWTEWFLEIRPDAELID